MATAVYIGTDTTTGGSWRGVYGGDGFYRASGGVVAIRNQPAWLTAIANNGNSLGWSAAAPSPYDEYTGSTTTGQVLSNAATAIIDLTVSGSVAHRASVYIWDGGGTARAMKIDVTDTSDVVLATYTTPINLSAGRWSTFEFTGSVRIKITNPAGGTGFLSAVAFDPPPTSPGRLLRLGSGVDGLAYIS